MEKLIGAEIRSGKFTPPGKTEEIAYNNLILFTTSVLSGEDESNYCGEKTNFEAKIKNEPEIIEKVFGKNMTISDIKKQLGKPVDVLYDQYKNVARVIFYDSNPFEDYANGTITPPPAKGGKS